jgi:hypothetical protein
MRLIPTPEMNELEKVFSPYSLHGGFVLKDDAPMEAQIAAEKYKKLWIELRDKMLEQFCY